MIPDVHAHPEMARRIAINAAKALVNLNAAAGVVGVDHVFEVPQVQMANLNALRTITGNLKLKMERADEYTRYSITIDGVEFFFLSPKKVQTNESLDPGN